jgi:hypothetical protein
MTIQKKSMIVMALAILALASYGVARYYSPALVLHVVEQSLVQKAPPGTDPVLLRKQLHSLLSATPDQKTKMDKLLHISAYLEKVQRLTSEELYELMEVEKPGTAPVL